MLLMGDMGYSEPTESWVSLTGILYSSGAILFRIPLVVAVRIAALEDSHRRNKQCVICWDMLSESVYTPDGPIEQSENTSRG